MRAKDAGAGLLATTDPRYHHPARRRLADVLTAIRLGRTVDAIGFAAERNGERCLKSPAEMARLFADCPEAIGNTVRVLDACAGFSLDQLRHEYPDEILEPGRTPQQTLAGRVQTAATARWPEGVPPDIEARLAHELRLIEQLQYAPYFLIVGEVVRFARRKGILCQGRGSAANSATCYVLGITAVAPPSTTCCSSVSCRPRAARRFPMTSRPCPHPAAHDRCGLCAFRSDRHRH